MRFSFPLPLAAIALAAFTIILPTSAQSQAVAATPPMGWNSWNYFAGKSH